MIAVAKKSFPHPPQSFQLMHQLHGIRGNTIAFQIHYINCCETNICEIYFGGVGEKLGRGGKAKRKKWIKRYPRKNPIASAKQGHTHTACRRNIHVKTI